MTSAASDDQMCTARRNSLWDSTRHKDMMGQKLHTQRRIAEFEHSLWWLQDIAWARAELARRGVTGPGPLPEISE